MIGPEDRPTFEETFGTLNELQRARGGSQHAIVIARYPKDGRLDVRLVGQGGQMRFKIPFERGSGGNHWGPFGLPEIGQLVEYEPDNGMLDGLPTGGKVTGVVANSTNGEPPSPKTHPSLTDYSVGYQGRTGDGTPGAIDAYLETGDKFAAHPGKDLHVQLALGHQTSIVQGLAVTSQELHALQAGNSADSAASLAEAVSGDDHEEFANACDQVADHMFNAAKSAGAAASLHHKAILDQLDTHAIAAGAADLASGGVAPTSLGG